MYSEIVEILEDKCVMPEMPYCPVCEHGLIVYPEWVETYDDTFDSGCEWICRLEVSTTKGERNGKV